MFTFTINLAPIKYRNILKTRGGPIEKLTYKQRLMPDGKIWHEVHSYLQEHLKKNNSKIPNVIYNNHVDGSGSHSSLYIAKLKAISESLERWAFMSCQNNSKTFEQYGFNIENSTTGMGAFPGVFPYSARNFAKNEALERWSVCAFWENKITVKKITYFETNTSITCYQLIIPNSSNYIVLLHKKIQNTSRHCYGFSCDQSMSKAVERATVELLRNESVLIDFDLRKIDHPNLINEIQSVWEKRLLYFSTEEGYSKFLEAISKSQNLKECDYTTPELIVDKRIVGPWEKHTWVWRCLYKPISDLEHTTQEYFLF